MNERLCPITGVVSLTGNLTFDNKLALAGTYGDIDNTENPLFISYSRRAINSISIQGPSYITETGLFQYKLVCSPSTGNDFALKDSRSLLENKQVERAIVSGRQSYVFQEHSEYEGFQVLRPYSGSLVYHRNWFVPV